MKDFRNNKADLFVDKCYENEKWGGYNWFAIGNSITLHGICNYWWSVSGMAASKPEKDYFHLVDNFLTELHGNICSMPYNFTKWEIMDTDRAETLELIDCYLNPYLNLVTVQLGENVSELETFEEDFEFLLEHIQNICCKAQIIVIGDVWKNSQRDKTKRLVAERCNVDFTVISEIWDKEEYQCGLETIVYGDDGQSHTVRHKGASLHPGDKGMEYIAEKVEALLRKEV